MISKKTQKQIKYRRMLEAKEDKHYNEFTDHNLIVTINRCIDILKMRLTRDEFINFNITTKELSIIKSIKYKNTPVNNGKTYCIDNKTYLTEDDVLPF